MIPRRGDVLHSPHPCSSPILHDSTVDDALRAPAHRPGSHHCSPRILHLGNVATGSQHGSGRAAAISGSTVLHRLCYLDPNEQANYFE